MVCKEDKAMYAFTFPKLPLPIHAPFLNLKPADASAASFAAGFLGVGREGDWREEAGEPGAGRGPSAGDAAAGKRVTRKNVSKR